MVTYEQRLNSNLDWALREGSMHFENASAVHKTLRKFFKRLEEFSIQYAVIGDMAMFFHGYRRFTEHLDMLVSAADLAEIHRHLEGLDYQRLLAGSRHFRDAEFGVKIEFFVSGDHPGDGKPAELAFPNPQDAAIEIEGVRCLQLSRLVELKLAAGMANPRRMIHFGDVQEMIGHIGLPENLADQLHPFVREKYSELWRAVRDNPE